MPLPGEAGNGARERRAAAGTGAPMPTVDFGVALSVDLAWTRGTRTTRRLLRAVATPTASSVSGLLLPSARSAPCRPPGRTEPIRGVRRGLALGAWRELRSAFASAQVPPCGDDRIDERHRERGARPLRAAAAAADHGRPRPKLAATRCRGDSRRRDLLDLGSSRSAATKRGKASAAARA